MFYGIVSGFRYSASAIEKARKETRNDGAVLHDFIGLCLHMQELASLNESVSVLMNNKWPKSKNNTCFDTAGVSALAVILNLSQTLHFLGLLYFERGLKVKDFTQLEILPKLDQRICRWESYFAEHINERLPEKDWPTWRVRQETARLISNAEYEQSQTQGIFTKDVLTFNSAWQSLLSSTWLEIQELHLSQPGMEIIEGLGYETLKGPALAKKAGYKPYGGQFKGECSNLVKARVFDKTGQGYRLTSRGVRFYHAIKKKSGP